MSRAHLKKEWEARVAAYRASGLSIPKWCAANDVKAHQLRYWLKKIEAVESSANPKTQWISIEISDNEEDNGSSVSSQDSEAEDMRLFCTETDNTKVNDVGTDAAEPVSNAGAEDTLREAKESEIKNNVEKFAMDVGHTKTDNANSDSSKERDSPNGLAIRIGPAIIDVRPGFNSVLLRQVVRALTVP
ncbi:IS66 family insertion sequence element accessory protein TnpA [Heliorestis convoluta]|uniref:Transposase n=1 Tax=Heliorestis convoluta TaxID=356322 RepID=A0A5Q2MZZ4_9FIRM|nr:hypothetical protein [Heliorestis convoluta]QGG48328.1 hypothetical protein FTV88_2230 [Heliorestis convoluta]